MSEFDRPLQVFKEKNEITNFEEKSVKSGNAYLKIFTNMIAVLKQAKPQIPENYLQTSFFPLVERVRCTDKSITQRSGVLHRFRRLFLRYLCTPVLSEPFFKSDGFFSFLLRALSWSKGKIGNLVIRLLSRLDLSKNTPILSWMVRNSSMRMASFTDTWLSTDLYLDRPTTSTLARCAYDVTAPY